MNKQFHDDQSIRRVVPKIWSHIDKHTHTQRLTDTLITILHSPVGHLRNFTLKSGCDQWRRQDLVSGGTTIEAPKARASRLRVGGVWGGVSAPQTRGSGWAPWATLAGSGAEPQPLSHFLHILGPEPFWWQEKYDSLAQKSGGDSHHHYQKSNFWEWPQ